MLNTKRLFNGTMSIAFSISVMLMSHSVITTNAEDTLEGLQSRQAYLIDEQTRLNKVLNSLKDSDSKKSKYVDVLEKQINVFCEQIDIENKKTFLLDEEIKQKVFLIEQSQEKIADHMEKFKQRLRAIFKAGGETAFIATILRSDSLESCLHAADVAQVIGKHDTKLFKELNSEMMKLEDEKNEVEKKKKEATRSKEVLEIKREELRKVQEDNKRILEERERKAREEREAKEAKKAEEARIAMSKNISHNKNSSNYLNVQKNGKYAWPVPGHNRITSYWGDGRNHKGIDISDVGIYGAAIVATADGTVVVANSTDKWGSGWGYHVKIDHGSGYATQYAHCSLITVSCGQHVKAGQVIGYIGNTGNSYGAHLHFETWKDGSRYDPMKEL